MQITRNGLSAFCRKCTYRDLSGWNVPSILQWLNNEYIISRLFYYNELLPAAISRLTDAEEKWAQNVLSVCLLNPLLNLCENSGWWHGYARREESGPDLFSMSETASAGLFSWCEISYKRDTLFWVALSLQKPAEGDCFSQVIVENEILKSTFPLEGASHGHIPHSKSMS